jgi:hypothetical protein
VADEYHQVVGGHQRRRPHGRGDLATEPVTQQRRVGGLEQPGEGGRDGELAGAGQPGQAGWDRRVRPFGGHVDSDQVTPLEQVVLEPPQQRVGGGLVLGGPAVVRRGGVPAGAHVVGVQRREGGRRVQQQRHPKCQA